MTMRQLLMTLVSFHATNGNCFSENSHFSDISHNISGFLDFIKWPYNSSMNADIHFLRIKGNDNANEVNNETSTLSYNSSTTNHFERHNADSLSIMWYLASFGALVMFFLLISFSEVCCKKSFTMLPEEEAEVSPPSYDLFAPPTYDSLFSEKKEKGHKTKKKKKKCEIFVISMFGDKIISRVANSETPQRSNAEPVQVPASTSPSNT